MYSGVRHARLEAVAWEVFYYSAMVTKDVLFNTLFFSS